MSAAIPIAERPRDRLFVSFSKNGFDSSSLTCFALRGNSAKAFAIDSRCGWVASRTATNAVIRSAGITPSAGGV